MLKRGYIGVYHKMSPKHLGRYVAEFEKRHNIREDDTVEQMGGAPTRCRSGVALGDASRGALGAASARALPRAQPTTRREMGSPAAAARAPIASHCARVQ